MDSPSATPCPTARPPLSDRINRATRLVHARLNKCILRRLPQALPPYTADPALYASGLLHIAPIYLVFESLWHNLVSDNTATDASTSSLFSDTSELSFVRSSHSHTQPPSSLPDCPPHIRAALTRLYLPTLRRSASLHSDLRAITGWSPAEVSTQLRLAAASGPLSRFLAHTKHSVDRHPHVLLAHAWVLYMALFSGGRFLRATLEEATPAFWKARADPVAPAGCACYEPAGDELPLSFFRFATPEDGEDLKREFKRRLVEVEGTLSDQEMAEVVQEAVCVFDNMMLLVGQLDGIRTGNAGCENAPPQSVEEGWAAALLPKFLARVRDSLAVARERGLKGIPTLWGKRQDDTSSPKNEKDTAVEPESREKIAASGVEPESREKIVASAVEPGPARTVRFGTDTKGDTGDGNQPDDGRLQFASFSSMRNAAVVVGVAGVVWGLGHIAR